MVSLFFLEYTPAIASATSFEQVNELLGAVELSLRGDHIQALNRASTGK